MSPTRAALFGTAILAILVLGALPFGPAHATAAQAPHDAHPDVRSLAAATSLAHPAASTALGIHPLIICPPTPPPSPVYTLVGDLFPMTPQMTLQQPCDPVDEDEVHATLSTTHAFSGEDYQQPVWLPPDASNASQDQAIYQVYVGMVVGGNPDSEWRQSYAEVAFTPNGADGWNEEVAVWSLVNSSFYGGNLTNSVADCPSATSMWFSWNYSYYCEVNEAAGATFGTTVPGGDWVNVTFAGVKGGSDGLNLWVNDSTEPTFDTNFTFNATNTGSYTFEPFYNVSCTDSCMLAWAYHFGLGFGIFPAAYDEPLLRSLLPLTFGIPHYEVNGAYSGEYQYFSPESASGACFSGSATPTVAACNGYQVAPNTGYYPYFTFNGTEINFGTDWPWTTIEWGESGQFYSSGIQQDLIPLSFYRTSNSSRAGFSAPGVPITINATVQDLGTVTGVNLTYSLSGGNPTTIAMALVSGTTTNGTYTATIPSTVGNGLLNYSIAASNHAGMTELSPPLGSHQIRRGPLPLFNVTVTTNLLSCGKVTLNGTSYANGSTVAIYPGDYALYGVGCYPWNFTVWTFTGGVVVLGDLAVRGGTVEISADGTLAAHWSYVRPMDNVTVAVDPSVCAATVTIGNQTLVNGHSGLFPDGEVAVLNQSGCGGYLFAGWTFDGNFTILNPSFTPHGNGTLTANFVSSSIAVALVFYTAPSTCGGVLYRGAGYANGESLSVAPGTYPLAGDPCDHYGLLDFTTQGLVSATSSSITVNGSGAVTEVNYHLTEVNIQVNPAGCGVINVDGQDFSNDQVDVVANNSTHVAYPVATPGCYLIAFSANGGLTLSGNELIANGSGNLTASFQTTAPVQTIAFLTDPSTCGTIEFDGQPFINANYTQVAAGLSYTISAVACFGYGFVSWQTFGEITITGSAAWVNSSGAIEAVFQPLVPLYLFTTPATCGQVVVNGVDYSSNSSVELASLNRYSVGAIPCAGYVFAGWQNTSGVEISGNTIFLLGGAFLTALFTPQVFAVTTYIVPAGCGTVRLNGQSMTNGSVLRLTVGSYALVPLPCVGDHLDHWAVNGSITVSGSELEVNGAGNLTAYYAPVLPSVTLNVPPSSLAGDAVELIATVGVPIPPYTYNYTWTFGDGTTAVTTANATLHTYGSAGTYTISVMVRDPDNRTANASTTITILSESAASAVTFTTGELVGFGLVAAALVAVLALVVLRRRGDGGGSSGDSTELATPGSSAPAVSNMEQKP